MSDAPLPDEIAGLIKEIQYLSDHALRHNITTTLRMLAQENERLKSYCLEDAIEEMEEKDAEIERLVAERATIRAKTIEECASIADKYWAREVASQIRALDQTATEK